VQAAVRLLYLRLELAEAQAMTLVAIDPGVKHLGIAVFKDAVLERAFLADTPRFEEPWMKPNFCSLHGLHHVNELVIEKPQIYVAARSKGDPNDLIDLALVAGGLAGIFRVMNQLPVIYYRPSEWKKQAPKNVVTERTLASLSPFEIDHIKLPRAAKTLGHNVYDAIGIGLAHLHKTGVRVGKCFVKSR
jgi:hypothetical protein